MSSGEFLKRALSRRGFVRAAAGAAGAGVALGSGLWTAARADEDDGQRECGPPLPIPHLCTFFAPPVTHFYFPGPVDGSATSTDPTGIYPGGRDPSLIYNFKGSIGQADLCVSGTGTDTKTGKTARYDFHLDARFMKGVFIGADEEKHRGAFAFI